MANNVEITITANNKASKVFKEVSNDAGSMAKNISSIAGGIQLSQLVDRVQSLGVGLIKTGVGFNALKEQAQNAFTTMLRSGEKATLFLEDLQNFALKTPFELPGLVTGAQRLMAMGFAAGEVIPTMTALGNAVAGLGGTEETLNRVMLAIGQMRAKGVVSAEEMRQLTEAGIDAWQMLADKIGKTVPEAMKLVENRMVSSSTGITAILDGINKKFDGMMDKQSKTFNGMLSNLKDMISQASGRVFEPLFLKAKEKMEELLGVTASPDWETNLDRIELGVFGVVKAIDQAIDKTTSWLGKIKDIADSDVFKLAGGFLLGVPLTGLRATGILGGGGGGGTQGTFKPPSEFQLRENELRERLRQRSGNLSDEERLILEQDSMRKEALRRQMRAEKGPEVDPPFKAATDKLIDVLKEVSNSFQEAMAKVDEAINGIFGRETKDQLQLKRQIDDFKNMGKGVHFGPGFKGTSEQLAEKAQKELEVIDKRHERMKLDLQLLDATRKTEADLNKEYQKALEIIPGYTARLKILSEQTGISLNPSLEGLASSAVALKGAFNGPGGLMEAAFAFANWMRKQADPNASTLGPGGAYDAHGELLAAWGRP